MRRKTFMVVVMTLFSLPVWGQEGEGKWAKRLWKASIAAVAAGSVMDIQSSLGKHETNGLLANHQGLFSAQGIGLKLAITGAAMGAQQFMVHRHPTVSKYKTGALINFAVAGALTGVAAHNYGVRPVQ
jgi:hypothetical protein